MKNCNVLSCTQIVPDAEFMCSFHKIIRAKRAEQYERSELLAWDRRNELAPEVQACPDEACDNRTALRYNTGKVDLTLIPIDAQEAEARVWMAGEKKYGRNNWEKLWGDKTTDVVLASMLRHIAAIQKGETHDAESGQPHAAHIRCNAAMLIRYVAK